jgi:hypothetical protein
MNGIPAYFVTTIHLDFIDRLKVLWHGKIIYRGEIEPDPGEFEVVKVTVRIPNIRKGRMPKIGFEEVCENNKAKAND